jgi:trans-2,3-dihydro-3-hydroxyanthranilate isomerase
MRCPIGPLARGPSCREAAGPAGTVLDERLGTAIGTIRISRAYRAYAIVDPPAEAAMPTHDYVTVNVFTDQRFTGNPLAVIPNAAGLNAAQMQAIAAEFNLSETAFVLPPTDPRHHARVRIFTSTSEMAFAGHPNVGTGYVLASMAAEAPEHYTFEEIAGLVRVHVLRDTSGAVSGARVAAPRSLSIDIGVPVETVAACAGLTEDDIATQSHTPLVASVGTPFVIAEITNVAALSRATPDIAAFRTAAARFPDLSGSVSIYLYAWVDGGERRIRARMFAPLARRRLRGSRDRQCRRRAGCAADLARPRRKRGPAIRDRAGRRDGTSEPHHRLGRQSGGRTGNGERGRNLRARDARDAAGLAVPETPRTLVRRPAIRPRAARKPERRSAGSPGRL